MAKLEQLLEFMEPGQRSRLAAMIESSDSRADAELGIDSIINVESDGSYSVLQRFGKIAEAASMYYGKLEGERGPQITARLGHFWKTLGDYYTRLSLTEEKMQNASMLPRFKQKAVACYFEAWNTFLDEDYHAGSARELVGRVPELLKIKTVWEHDQHPADFEYAKPLYG